MRGYLICKADGLGNPLKIADSSRGMGCEYLTLFDLIQKTKDLKLFYSLEIMVFVENCGMFETATLGDTPLFSLNLFIMGGRVV